MKDSIKELLEMILLVALVLAALTGVVWGIASLRSHTEDVSIYRDSLCKKRYGKEYSYTERRGADCVNEKTGESKFLKELL